MKQLFSGLLLLIILHACTQQPNNRQAFVKQYFDHFNKHDWPAMAAMYADIAMFKDPSYGHKAVRQTHQQIIEKYTALAKSFPNITDEVVQVYPSGSRHIVVEFVSRGTSPEGQSFELPVCTIFTIEAGKIAEDFTYYDNF